MRRVTVVASVKFYAVLTESIMALQYPMRTSPAPETLDYRDVEGVMQTIRFQLYRENIGGALDIADAAHRAHPDPRYAEQAARIRSWLMHLESRDRYIDAQEAQYRRY